MTADILFLQKRERKIDIEPDWVHLGVTENGIAVNSYFAEHPEMMLGSMEYDTRIYGQDSRYTVCVNNDENFNMYETLNKAIGNIKAQMTDFERVADEAEQTEEVIPADPDVRNYTYTFFEGKLYYRENSEMVKKEVSQTAEERIRSLDEIRQITRELIDIQMDGCSEEELSDKQRLLNVKYDAFVKQYGAITSKANRIAFRDDSDYPLLCSLEEVNEDGEVKKADMFYKQTIKAKTVIDRVETAVEALNVSVNEFGYVNLAYMLSIYEPDITNAKEELAEKSGQTVDEITLFGIGFGRIASSDIEIMKGCIFAALLLWGSSVPLYLWQLILAFQFGKGVSIGAGIISGLISALMLTGLGDYVWKYVFVCWTGRVPYTYLQSVLGETSVGEWLSFIPGCLIFTGISMVYYFWWVNHWEGNRISE